MAITHANFLTQVRNYTEVSSSVLSDTLRRAATSTFTAGNRAVSLPADLIVMRSVEHIDSGGNRTFLEKKDSSFISEFNGTGKQGTPKYFANFDDFNIIVAPTPAAADTVQINYIQDPPHFDASTNTFISTYQESMLLHGVLAECFRFLKGPDNLYNLYNSKYNEEIQNFALQQMGRRRRAEYDDGVPRIKIPSPAPNTTY